MTAQNGDERSHFDTLGSFLFAVLISRIADFAQQIKRIDCLLYTSPSPRDRQKSRMPSSA